MLPTCHGIANKQAADMKQRCCYKKCLCSSRVTLIILHFYLLACSQRFGCENSCCTLDASLCELQTFFFINEETLMRSSWKVFCNLSFYYLKNFLINLWTTFLLLSNFKRKLFPRISSLLDNKLWIITEGKLKAISSASEWLDLWTFLEVQHAWNRQRYLFTLLDIFVDFHGSIFF